MRVSMKWRRRLAGLLWLMIWMSVLYAVAAPWRELGGIVSERLRWLEWFVLLTGLAVGALIGRIGRDIALGEATLTHLNFLRFLLYPVAALTALSLLLLTFAGERGAAGVVASGFLSYWAGLDLSYGAVPLLDGKPYSLTIALPARESMPETERRDGEWVPPWERF